MSKADDMFEKLGYTIQIDDGKVMMYQKKWSSMWNKTAISFDRTSHFITFFDKESLTMKELQAINEKCKELGWEEN